MCRVNGFRAQLADRQFATRQVVMIMISTDQVRVSRPDLSRMPNRRPNPDPKLRATLYEP